MTGRSRRCGDTAYRRGSPTPLSVRGRASDKGLRVQLTRTIPESAACVKGEKSEQPYPIGLATLAVRPDNWLTNTHDSRNQPEGEG